MSNPKFSIGDIVVALSSTPPIFISRCQHRIKGEIYKVRDTLECDLCGSQSINISPFSSDKKKVLCMCSKAHDNRGVQWTASKEFALANDVLLNALADENYELAVKIRDYE
jgi:hypothetical protein